jgi:hypothetical protein
MTGDQIVQHVQPVDGRHLDLDDEIEADAVAGPQPPMP